MPRKNAPRCVCDPVQIVPPFDFTAAQRRQILDALPCVPKEESEFIAGLERCAHSFLWRRNQYSARWTQAEQNAALMEISPLARELTRRLRCLDMGAEWALMLSAGVDYLPDFADRLERVADGAARTLELGKKRTGPHRNPAIDRIMSDLKRLYEQHTGKVFSHNPKQKTEYLGAPQSAAGRFVAVFFQAVDPSITQTAISTAMASVVRARRSARSSRNVLSPIGRETI
jgi:hypothetical protein